MEQELFEFDDFFVDDSDQGVPQTVELVDAKGNKRQVSIFVKKGLSLEDREASKAAATRVDFSPTGQPKITGFDDGVFEVELLTRCIKSWPFERVIRDAEGTVTSRTPVAVTRDNVARLRATVADGFAVVLQKLIQGPSEADLAPFENPSDAAS